MKNAVKAYNEVSALWQSRQFQKAIKRVRANLLVADLTCFVLEYLREAHPECLHRAIIHYIRVNDIPEIE